MPDETQPGSTGARELDVAHVAKLANLPLDASETAELKAACEQVLDTFALGEQRAPDETEEHVRLTDDEPDAWPEEGIEAILEAMPRRDGRNLRV